MVAIDQAELYEQARVAAATATAQAEQLRQTLQELQHTSTPGNSRLNCRRHSREVQVGKIAVLIKVCGYVVHSSAPSSIA